MAKGSILAAVEVKFRQAAVDIETLISNRKKAALVCGMERFLAMGLYDPSVIRFDLAVVSLLRGRPVLTAYWADFFQA